MRIEYCSGGHKTVLSGKLRRLHQKFYIPSGSELLLEEMWTQDNPNVTPSSWVELPDAKAEELIAVLDTEAYVEKPFKDHEEYCLMIGALATVHPQFMGRKNDSGRTTEDILRSATDVSHYGCLQHGLRYLAGLSVADRKAVPCGTTGNEAWHREVKGWCHRQWVISSSLLVVGNRDSNSIRNDSEYTSINMRTLICEY